MTAKHAKLLILGSGPAGYTAAVYAARAMLNPVLIQGIQPGGQLTITTDVENYPGFADVIQGPWLMEQMRLQAEHVGTHMISDHITKVDLSQRPFRLEGDGGDTYTCDSLIVSTGAQAKWLGLPGEDFVVLCVGGIDPRKNVPFLVRAFAEVLRHTERGSDALLLLVGPMEDDDQLPALTHAIERLDVGDRVRTLGRVSDAELADQYHAADVLAFPSLYEGFGLPVLEAMASGLPVVCGRNSSLPEIAGDAPTRTLELKGIGTPVPAHLLTVAGPAPT